MNVREILYLGVLRWNTSMVMRMHAVREWWPRG